MTATAYAATLFQKPAFGRPTLIVGALLAALPLVAGLIYRTYWIGISPPWLEATRQLGFLFLLAEVVVILRARDRGLRFGAYWSAMGSAGRLLLALFLATFWISSVFVSPYPAFSTFLTLSWIIHLGFAVAVHFLADRTDRGDVLLFGWLVVLGLVLLLPVIAMHFAFPPSPDSVPGGKLVWTVAVPGFISLRLFGAYTAGLTALSLGLLWVFDPRGRQAWLGYGALTLVLAAMIWSGTRAALPGIAVAIVAGAMLARQRPSARFFLLVPLCGLAGAILAVMLAPDEPHFLLFSRFLRPWQDYVDMDALSSGRLALWGQAWRAFLEVPLFGAGSGSNHWLTIDHGIGHFQPHNVVLQFLMNWGVFAGSAGLALLGRATWLAHRAVQERVWLLPLVMLLDCLLTIALLDGTLYFTRFVMLIMACYGLCLAGFTCPRRAGEA